MNDYKYKLRYMLGADKKPGDWIVSDAARGFGLTDSYIFISIIEPKDEKGEGPYSMHMRSRDGFSEEPYAKLSGPQLFKAWSLMANDILNNYEPFEWQRMILQQAFESVCAVITSPREEPK